MGWRRWVRLIGGLVLVLAVYFVLPMSDDPGRSEVVRLVLSSLLIAALTLGVIWQVRLQMLDNSRHVDGLVFALALAIVAFAAGFYVIEQQSPDQIDGLHTRLDALYFTTSTLLTVGFGDVHAAGQVARGVVLVQMLFNVAVIATAATTITTRIRERALERVQSRAASGAADHSPLARRHRGSDRSTHRKPT